jgi:RNA polymerase sigma factor (sigma-70 family)
MRNEPTGASRQLDRLFRLGTVGGMTDSQLLEQFVSGDEGLAALAFEAIVDRHGPMVLRVCRMSLHDVHAAEDAFQATFLVLARKARQLGSRELLGNWLYGVAARTARKTRVIAARRHLHDRQAASWRTDAVEDRPRDQGQDDLERVLHEEIGRLPHSYRAAIVVCYLEGLSQAQAAHQLCVAESTVRGRLARARKLLGQRLMRRGIVPSTGLMALSNSADAGWRLPDAIARATARAALSFVNRGQAIPNVVAATAHDIANGVLFTMWFSNFKTIAVTLVVLGLVGAGTSLVTQRPAAARAPLEQSRTGADVGSTIASSGSAQDERSKSAQVQAKRRQEPQSVRVNPDLAKLVQGPIVRTTTVSKDCMVLAYLPDWNFGNVDNIGIGNNDGGVRTLLDWPAIPPDEVGSLEHQFLIAVYARETISHPPASAIHAFEILTEWPERTSWKRQPRYAAEPAATYKFEPGVGWKVFDVTALVRARAKAGRDGHGVLIRFLDEDVPGGPQDDHCDYKMVSREATAEWADRRPVLLVVKASKPAKALSQ